MGLAGSTRERTLHTGAAQHTPSVVMGEEKMEVEETTLPEENHEVDSSIQLYHKIFLLSNPSLCDDVAALGEEVKQTVLDRGERPRATDAMAREDTRWRRRRAIAVDLCPCRSNRVRGIPNAKRQI